MTRSQARVLIPTCGIACLLLFLAIIPVFATDEAMDGTSPRLPAWEKAASLLTREALADFESIRQAGGQAAREAAFGTGLMLLNTQPKTDGNIQAAADLFDEVAQTPDDELGILAAYYRARLEQVHRIEPDLGKADELFTRLIEKHPSHPAAQFAVVKRAMITLYDDSPPARKMEQLDQLEESAKRLTHAPAQRDLHLLLAHAFSRLFQDDERTLRHLLAAEELGIVRSNTRRDVWVQIGENARLTGRTELAAKYYRRFLDNARMDNRIFAIEQKLEYLDRAAAAKP